METGSAPRTSPRWRPPGDPGKAARCSPMPPPTGGSTSSKPTDEQLWATDPGAAPEQLVWSDDSARLLVVTAGRRHPLYTAAGRPAGALETPEGQDVLDASFAPGTRAIGYSIYAPATDQSSIVLAGERLQQGEGRFEDLVFSPNGRWLLTGWPAADQLLFIRLPGVSGLVTVPDIRQEFDPGGVGATSFPRVAEWCCRPSG